jgi:hypothetical protein
MTIIKGIGFAAALLGGCEPDWSTLTNGTPSLACEFSAVEDAITEVPLGECWRVVALRSDLAVNVAAFRRATSAYKMLGFATSEPNRAAYREGSSGGNDPMAARRVTLDRVQRSNPDRAHC